MSSISNNSKKDKENDINVSNIQVDLRKPVALIGNKRSNTYSLEDNDIKVVTLDNDIVVKLMENNMGIFVDIRKYYKGYPTKKGIRILASNFKKTADILEDDIIQRMPALSVK